MQSVNCTFRITVIQQMNHNARQLQTINKHLGISKCPSLGNPRWY